MPTAVQRNYDWNSREPRLLYTSWLDDNGRDHYLERTFLEPLREDGNINEYNILSIEQGRLPHWRALIVRDNTTGAYINILPNGGFANGWEFDNREYRPGGFWRNKCDINTPIPIVNQQPVLYDVKVDEPLWNIDE